MTNQADQQQMDQDFPATDAPLFERPTVPLTQISATQGYATREEIVAPELATKPGAGAEAQVEQGIQALLSEMGGLRRDFDTKIKYDESKERLIERLHRELQFYREGLDFRLLRPIFADLIMLYDDMGKVIDRLSVDTVSISEQIIQSLRAFQENIEEILQRNGVQVFNIEGELFSPARQRSLSVIPTNDPAQDKHIARRVRQGFAYEDKLLRHELVEVYKYIPASV